MYIRFCRMCYCVFGVELFHLNVYFGFALHEYEVGIDIRIILKRTLKKWDE
jgi:hypothetical protein